MRYLTSLPRSDQTKSLGGFGIAGIIVYPPEFPVCLVACAQTRD